VEYTRVGAGLDAKITLPQRVSGNFEFKGKEWALKAGENTIKAR